MNHQHTNFGPWTTSLDSGSRLQLSTFWRQRMRRLPGLASAARMPRRTLAVALMLAIAVLLVPLVGLVPVAPAEADEERFSQITTPSGKTSTLATRAADPTKEERAAMRQHQTRQQEIIKQLAEQHGYKLEPGQLLKHIGKPLPKLRNHLADQPCVNFFQSTPEWTMWTNSRIKEGTLAIALKGVFHLRVNQIECDPALLDRPFPGDWVASWDPRKFRSPTTEEVAAFEEAVNVDRSSKLAFEWKQVEEMSLVVKGNYKFSPVARPDGELEIVKGDVAKQADGTFQFPIRRNSTVGSVGSYPEFLQAIGEVVGMVIVDEADEGPAKRSFFWKYANKLIPGHAPLDPTHEKTFLDSLSKQTGFQFVKEKRIVHKLFIKADPAIATE